jgi:hypothetical protein
MSFLHTSAEAIEPLFCWNLSFMWVFFLQTTRNV